MERISGDYSADKIKRDAENELLKEKAKLLDKEIKEDIENETDR